MQFRTLKSLMEYLLFLPVNRIARRLYVRGAGKLGSALGGFVWRCGGYRRGISLDNLTRAFPEKSREEITAIALGAYRGYGRALMEMLWSGGAGEEELLRTMTLENPRVPLDALARGKGLILLSGHFGAWEFIVTAMSLRLGRPVIAIAQPQRNRYIDAVITGKQEQVRERHGHDASVCEGGDGSSFAPGRSSACSATRADRRNRCSSNFSGAPPPRTGVRPRSV